MPFWTCDRVCENSVQYSRLQFFYLPFPHPLWLSLCGQNRQALPHACVDSHPHPLPGLPPHPGLAAPLHTYCVPCYGCLAPIFRDDELYSHVLGFPVVARWTIPLPPQPNHLAVHLSKFFKARNAFCISKWRIAAAWRFLFHSELTPWLRASAIFSGRVNWCKYSVLQWNYLMV